MENEYEIRRADPEFEKLLNEEEEIEEDSELQKFRNKVEWAQNKLNFAQQLVNERRTHREIQAKLWNITGLTMEETFYLERLLRREMPPMPKAGD